MLKEVAGVYRTKSLINDNNETIIESESKNNLWKDYVEAIIASDS